MSDFFRENWFVVVVALLICGFLGYFIYDANRDNVSGKQSDGKDVVASLTDTDITADELFARGSEADGQLLYNLYRNAVVSQSVETTSAMEQEAKSMQKTIESNVRSQNSDAYQTAIDAELAGYGFDGLDEVYDYCLVNLKLQELDKQYVNDHFDSLSAPLEEKSPRLVSQIVVSVSDLSELTEEEQQRLDNIDQALETGTFAEAATAFSDDVNTADKEGFAGYLDSDSAYQGTSVVSSEAAAAALELEKGETSEWLDVTDSSTYATYKVKVYVDETDPAEIFKNEDESVQKDLLSAILSANTGLEVHVVQKAAEKLKVDFQDASAKARLEEYMDAQKGEAEYE